MEKKYRTFGILTTNLGYVVLEQRRVKDCRDPRPV